MNSLNSLPNEPADVLLDEKHAETLRNIYRYEESSFRIAKETLYILFHNTLIEQSNIKWLEVAKPLDAKIEGPILVLDTDVANPLVVEVGVYWQSWINPKPVSWSTKFGFYIGIAPKNSDAAKIAYLRKKLKESGKLSEQLNFGNQNYLCTYNLIRDNDGLRPFFDLYFDRQQYVHQAVDDVLKFVSTSPASAITQIRTWIDEEKKRPDTL